jgi:hypothetical protein
MSDRFNTVTPGMQSDVETDIPHPGAIVQNFLQAADIIF